MWVNLKFTRLDFLTSDQLLHLFALFKGLLQLFNPSFLETDTHYVIAMMTRSELKLLLTHCTLPSHRSLTSATLKPSSSSAFQYLEKGEEKKMLYTCEHLNISSCRLWKQPTETRNNEATGAQRTGQKGSCFSLQWSLDLVIATD